MADSDLILPLVKHGVRNFVERDPDLLEATQHWTDTDRDGKLSVWNTVKLDGKVFPGVDDIDSRSACIVIPSAKVRYAVDRQRVKGLTKDENKNLARQEAQGVESHRIVSEGYMPGPVSLKCFIWRPDQWQAWLKYLPTLNPKIQANKLRPFFIDHPFLAALGINQIFINEIGTPEETGTYGLFTFEIGAYEVFDSTRSTVAKAIKAKDTAPADGGFGVGVRAPFVYDTGPR